MKIHKLTIGFWLIILIIGSFQISFANVGNEKHLIQQTQIFWRTELYFGRDKNDGTEVTEQDWEKFVDEYITPKFPQGLTVLDAKGQWRNDSGKIIKESSKLLILLYPAKTRKSANAKIEQIRRAYKKLFNQQSIMRIDTRQNYFID